MSDEKEYYVDNEELYQHICEWKRKCKEAGTIVKQPDEIGIAILKIAHGLSRRYNFSNYTDTWKSEMISDGIEVSIKGLIKFDEEKYNNPHAYITQACFRAYLQRIAKEKKETAIKHSYFVNHVYDSRDDDMTAIADESFIQDIYNKLQQYDASVTKQKVVKSDAPNLDFLYGEED